MIVIDSSAVVAILFKEGDAAIHSEAISAAGAAAISAVSVVETGIALITRHGPSARRDLDAFLYASNVRVEAAQAAHITIALDAYERYGKRRRHPAKLNFGDCFSYALAKALRAPLLFKGNDFSHTDIPAVL